MKRLSVVAIVVAALVAYVAIMVGLFETLPRSPRIVKTFSTDWAGHEMRLRHPTMISASWTVPQIATSQRRTAVATWIGIGGLSARGHLLQVGTCEATRGGIVSRDALVELWPAPPTPLTRFVSTDWVVPGDHVAASIRSVGRTRWTVKFSDATQGWTFEETVRFALRGATSAEWITERPPSIGRLPLFTPAHFTRLRVAGSARRPVVPRHLATVRMWPTHGSTGAVGPVHRDAFTDSYVRSA